MVTRPQYLALERATSSYLDDPKYDILDIERVMSDIFGSQRASGEGNAWSEDFTRLNLYEEKRREDASNCGPQPLVCYLSRVF